MSKIKQAMSTIKQAVFCPEVDAKKSSAEAKPWTEYPADSTQSHRLSRTKASSSTIAMWAFDAFSFMPAAISSRFTILNFDGNGVAILGLFYLGRTRPLRRHVDATFERIWTRLFYFGRTRSRWGDLKFFGHPYEVSQ